ncbi:hypothetical protein GCM10028808_72940 [Spirosoma migulaei]
MPENTEPNHNYQLALDHGYELMPDQKVHELKVWAKYFKALDDGTKPFEVRKNDRSFQAGDILFLHEYDPLTDTFGNQYLYREVTYVLHGGEFGIESGFVVMGLAGLD